MFKIFKYEVVSHDNKDYITVHREYLIIRMDIVDNKRYVWAIVNINTHVQVERVFFNLTQSEYNNKNTVNIDLLETQDILLNSCHKIYGMNSINGRFYLQCSTSSFTTDTTLTKHKIILRKTGQEIGYELKDLMYVGYGTIFIGQELCLYGFVVNESKT